MRQQIVLNLGAPEVVRYEGTIDLVVPFTTPELTRAELESAHRLSAGLNAAIRLVRIQIIPAQLQLHESPVSVEFLKEQLQSLLPEIPAARELRFARDFTGAFEATLTHDSIVVLAHRSRSWRTHNQRLADVLRCHGYRVLLAKQEKGRSLPCLTSSTVCS